MKCMELEGPVSELDIIAQLDLLTGLRARQSKKYALTPYGDNRFFSVPKPVDRLWKTPIVLFSRWAMM
jgi:hypothetical protein